MKYVCLLLCVVMLLTALVGCSAPADPVPAASTAPTTGTPASSAPTTTGTPPTSIPVTGIPATTAPEAPIPGNSLFAAAVESLEQASNRILTYTAILKRTVSGDLYSQTVNGNAFYSQLGSSDMTAVVEEQLDLGGYLHEYTEAYCEQTAYAIVSDTYFSSNLSADKFIQRQIPAVLLQADLYGQIIVTEQTDSTVTLGFSNPTGIERWIPGQNLQLISASGSAILDSAGKLVQTAYECTYTCGDASYTLSVGVRVSTPEALDLSAKHPAHDQECISLSELSAPRLMLQTVAQIYSGQHVICNGLETIYSQAIPYAYSLTTKFYLSGFGEELTTGAYYRTAVSDYRGQVVTKEQTDSYQDGVFSSVLGSNAPLTDSGKEPEAVRQQIEDKILSGLLALKYLDGATSTKSNGVLHLNLTSNALFRQDMTQSLETSLGLSLDSTSDSVQIQSIGGTLKIDVNTGLPLSFGLILELTHTKDGVPYQLTYKQERTLSFLADDA